MKENNNTTLEIKEKILDFFFGVKEISELNNEEVEYGSKDKPN